MEKLVFVHSTTSTNQHLEELIKRSQPKNGMAVATFHQTEGRGQKGHSWLSEPGSNLAYSVCLMPGFLPARDQFMLLKFVALTVKRFLDEYVKGISIKWPNDIYWNDRKLCGILMENNLKKDLVEYSVVGIGININQSRFPDSLTNPVSLKQATGQSFELLELTEKFHTYLLKQFSKWSLENDAEIGRYYLNSLYRRDGYHLYRDSEGEFSARMLGLAAQGHLILEKENGEVKEFDFKEVAFV